MKKSFSVFSIIFFLILSVAFGSMVRDGSSLIMDSIFHLVSSHFTAHILFVIFFTKEKSLCSISFRAIFSFTDEVSPSSEIQSPPLI